MEEVTKEPDVSTLLQVLGNCLEKFLLPNIKPGDTLVLDNLSSHKSELITKLCSDRGDKYNLSSPL